MVGELTKAMERVGLDMRVTALVSSFRPYKQAVLSVLHLFV